MTQAMIEVTDLWKAFGPLQVLKGISLDVPRGSAVALIGPSGSGKSTLLRCINLLEQPERGRVRVGDQVVECERKRLPRDRELAAFRARTGMVFQHFNLFPHMTALDNVACGPLIVCTAGWTTERTGEGITVKAGRPLGAEGGGGGVALPIDPARIFEVTRSKRP